MDVSFFRQSHAGAAILPPDNGGIGTGIERGDDGRFDIIDRRDSGSYDFGFLGVP